MHPVDDILKIECAGGDLLPYLGYVEVELKVPGDDVSVDGNFVFLVVPSTEYNKQVPLLIGTNILKLVLALS